MRLTLVLLGLLCLLSLWYGLPVPSLLANNPVQPAVYPSVAPAVKALPRAPREGAGMYPLDAAGELLLARRIKYRFEYFLSSLGDFPREQVVKMVEDDIRLNLQGGARQQALTLFADYLAYKQALATLEGEFDEAAGYDSEEVQRLSARLQGLRAKRRAYPPSAALDAFFGFDELYDDFVLTSLQIKHSQQLSPQQKRQQLQSLQLSLPREVQQMRDETRRISPIFKLAEEMEKQEGGQRAPGQSH